MKILLVNPTYREPESGRLIRSRIRYGRVSNLGLMQLAAVTPPQHEVRIVEDLFEEPDYACDCDLVGISTTTPLAPRAYEIAAAFKRAGKKVVLGGYHPTLNPEDAQRHADALVLGEGEPVWPRLLRDAESGQLAERYQADERPSLATLPTPRYDLFRNQGYRYTVWPVQFSRGCPYACRFCSITAFYGPHQRTGSVGRVLAAIDAAPGRAFMFVDDNLLAADRSELLELFTALESKNILWTAAADATAADDDELLSAAYRAGCRFLCIGFESFNQDSIASVGKQRSNRVADYDRVIEKTRSHGIALTASLMFGLPHDRPGDFLRAAEYLIEKRIPNMSAYLMTPAPGTAMEKEMKKENRIFENDWARFNGVNEVFDHPNFARGEMKEEYWRFHQRFYSLRALYQRFEPSRARSPFFWIELIYNGVFLRYWSNRRIHPFLANRYPTMVAIAFRFRDQWIESRQRLQRYKTRRLEEAQTLRAQEKII